jgi:hypothetical protein
MDTLEAALNHSTEEPSTLIDNLHAGIISSCRSVSAGMVKTQAAVASLSQEYDDEMETDEGVDISTLLQSLGAFGSGWEKKAVNHETWCNALVSILKEVSGIASDSYHFLNLLSACHSPEYAISSSCTCASSIQACFTRAIRQ